MENTTTLIKRIEQLESENRALKEQVAELSDFMENASIALHWVDDKGIILWANKAELDTLGYSKEEYIGSSIQNYHVDQEVIADIFARLRNNETLRNYPADLRCRDGSIRHVLISSNVLMKDGKFIHTRCFTKDVTPIVKEEKHRKALMQQLEVSETRLRLAVESTRLGTWDWDTSSNEIYVSVEGRKILGLPIEGAITAMSFLRHIHPDDRALLEARKEELLHRGEQGHFDITHRFHKFDDGSLRMIRVQGILHAVEGNSPRFIGTILDVTEVVAARENDARLAAIIRSSNDAIVGKTLDGSITYWNIAAERMFGYSEQEMIGNSILTIIPPDRKHEEDFILARLRSGETVEHFETRRMTKSGQLIDVSLTISPIKDANGEIIGASKIARDITEKKQEEQRKNDFVTMVSHEIKTPLTSTLLYTQLLLKAAKDGQNQVTLGLGLKIEAHIKKIIAMVKDYLSLARIEGEKSKSIRKHLGSTP